MPKLTSGMMGEPGAASVDKLPLLPKPMNCPEQCDEWKTSVAAGDMELIGCEHAMRTTELKEWLALLRPSRIQMTEGSTRRKKGVPDDEIEV